MLLLNIFPGCGMQEWVESCPFVCHVVTVLWSNSDFYVADNHNDITHIGGIDFANAIVYNFGMASVSDLVGLLRSNRCFPVGGFHF